VGGVDIQSIMRAVYTWMVLGMLLTAGFGVHHGQHLADQFRPHPIILIVAMVAEIGLVMGISWGFNKISAGTAAMLFFVYAALNGFTLSIILLTFSLDRYSWRSSRPPHCSEPCPSSATPPKLTSPRWAPSS